jgi:regulator of sigma E protease
VIVDVILPGILLLGILVFLHELGHFVAAKLLRVPVFKFSLGFGPAILAKTVGETRYQLSALPLGGYVSMAEERKNAEGEDELIDRFSDQPWWKRFLIAFAGPVGNLITGFLALVVMGMVGVRLADFDPVLGPMAADSKAAQVGLVEGSRFESVNGQPVASFQELLAEASALPAEQPLTIGIQDPQGAKQSVLVPADAKGEVLSSLTPPEVKAEIGSVIVGTPAYTAGLQQGDKVLAIDGAPIRRWQDLTGVVGRSAEKKLTFTIERGGRAFDVGITPQAQPNAPAGENGRIGIEAPRARTYLVRSNFVDSFRAAGPLTLALCQQTFQGLFAVIARPFQSAGSLGGPQMIVQIAAQNAKRGAGDFIYILAVISFAIMAFNLLPLPVLDGGHLFLALVEAVRRRPPAIAFTNAYQRVGLVLIGGFIAFVLFNDLSRSLQHRAAVERNNRAPQGELQPGQ